MQTAQDTRALWNSSPTPFTMQGLTYASMHNFIVTLGFPERHPHDHDRSRDYRKLAPMADPDTLEEIAQKSSVQFAWWMDKRVIYDSDEYTELVAQAMVEKFRQNAAAREVLNALPDAALLTEEDVPRTERLPFTLGQFANALEFVRMELQK
jgi:predicted NAD-dependent protein-ADP-ribosyltransferase YbiA (DUF1768 family)